MKKKYTKKQITETIAYWKKQLDESEATFRTDRLIAKKKKIFDMLYELRNFCAAVQQAYNLEKNFDNAGADLEFMINELGGSIDWKTGGVTLNVHS